MKKSLLIILSLIFMSMSAHAVGVDCWEEYSTTYEPGHTSLLQDVLGSKVTITPIKVDAYMWGTSSQASVKYPLPINTYITGSYYYSKTYYPGYFRFNEGINVTAGPSSSKYQLYPNFGETSGLYAPDYNAAKSAIKSGNITFVSYYKSGDYSYNLLFSGVGLYGAYAITYCIENTNSGGGGGGAAGASVNYIIKAN